VRFRPATSTLPVTTAPSAIAITGETMSPLTDAVGWRSTLTLALTFPATAPLMTIVCATRFASTDAPAPIDDDRLCLLFTCCHPALPIEARVALTLAGHTHGGQIVLPFLPPLWVPSEYGARFAYGHVVEQGRHMIVSGGLGCSKVPLRFGVPPEIVRITLGA